MQDVKEYTLTAKELGNFYGKSDQYVIQLRRNGALPYIKKGERFLFHDSCADYTLRMITSAKEAGLNKEPKHVVPLKTATKREREVSSTRDPHKKSRMVTNTAILDALEDIIPRLSRIETKVHAIMNVTVQPNDKPTIGTMLKNSIR